MSKCGIYCIENLINDKKYVGSSVDINKRIKHHFYLLKRNIHKNKHLQESFNINRIENFKFYILEDCSKEDLYSKEIYWMKLLNTKNNKFGYNMLNPGENNNLGFKQKEHTILLKTLKANKKVIQYSLDGIKVKEWNSIKEASEYFKISSSCITNCCKRKGSHRSSKGFIWRYEKDLDTTLNKTIFPKKIIQYDLNNNIINTFDSIHEAGRKTNIHFTRISSCINNKTKQINNYIFKNI